jgi:hypothetical protein
MVENWSTTLSRNNGGGGEKTGRKEEGESALSHAIPNRGKKTRRKKNEVI